ncbi:MAG: hypothetical protein ACLQU5_27450 [Isosphaeraceae bacterium]
MSRLHSTPGWFRSKKSRTAAGRGSGGPAHVPTRRKNRSYAIPGLELLEDRTLLSVSVTVAGDQVNFSGGSGDNLYLQVNSGGTLQYATTSGGTYTDVTNSQGDYQFDASTQVIFDHLTPLGSGGAASVGTLYLENMGTGGSSYSTDGSIDVQGNLTNSGQGIALAANVAIATGSAAGSSSHVTISTSSTTGSAGAISFSSPSITIGNSD